MKKNRLINLAILIAITALTSCSTLSSSRNTEARENQQQKITSAYDSAIWDSNTAKTWENLQRIPSSQLTEMKKARLGETEQTWVELALISKDENRNTRDLARALLAWHEQNTTHPANQLLPDTNTLRRLANANPPRQIAVLLPQNGSYASSSQRIREGFLNAYYTNQLKAGKQNVKFYDTSQTQDLASLYEQAVAEGADFVVGPLVKEDVEQMSKKGPFRTPLLALNYTEPHLFNALPGNFYEFGLLPEDEAAQLAASARRSGLSDAIIIAPQNAWGRRLTSAFSSEWQTAGGNIRETWYFSPKTNFSQEIAKLLHVDLAKDKELMEAHSNRAALSQQRRQDFNVIFLFASAKDAEVIVPTLKFYYVNNVPIYATSTVNANNTNVSENDLKDVVVCDTPSNRATDRLYSVGQDAYLLSQTLNQLETLQNFPIQGATGALVLSMKQQVHRRLPCRTVRHAANG
ncbi:MAG: hypothetical protein A3F14_03150 [Gammaproteobacteria bacterium RIFCSPHIGHO2_12_FULL_43_28]|nr:MAG: hypothetical protein A3F14_03150 [Gammaproteobacteria bacterium RIFCSPHIGHO2_12_FULL_43_28]